METVYKANDGTIFEDEEECETYEMKCKWAVPLSKCLAFDTSFNEVKISIDNEEWISKAILICAPSIEARKAVNSLVHDYWGYDASPFEEETFFTKDNHFFAVWNEDTEKFCDLEEKANQFQEFMRNLKKALRN